MDLGAMAIKRKYAFSMLLYYWSLTIRLFSVISRTRVWRVLHLDREAVGVLFCPSRLGQHRCYLVWNSIKYSQFSHLNQFKSKLNEYLILGNSIPRHKILWRKTLKSWLHYRSEYSESNFFGFTLALRW